MCCGQVQSGQCKPGTILTPILGAMLGDGPIRMITQGQELTVDVDEKTLAEMQFKEQQVGGRVAGRWRGDGGGMAGIGGTGGERVAGRWLAGGMRVVSGCSHSFWVQSSPCSQTASGGRRGGHLGQVS